MTCHSRMAKNTNNKKADFSFENVRPVLVLPFPIKRGRKGGEDAAVYFRSHKERFLFH
jgi:hypothetical protein